MAVLCLAGLLGACSSEGGREWRALYQLTRQSFGHSPSVTLAQASAIPYATIGIRIGTGPQSLGILGTSTNDEQLWVIGKNIVIVTRGGRIIRTVGLPHNLTWSTLRTTSGEQGAQEWSEARRISWAADFRDRNLLNVAINCDYHPVRTARVRILGKPIDTIRVEAHCHSPRLDWTFRNVYWASRTSGLVWRSVEYIHPDMDPIQIEVLRPPG